MTLLFWFSLLCLGATTATGEKFFKVPFTSRLSTKPKLHGKSSNVGFKVITSVNAGNNQTFGEVVIDTGSAALWLSGYEPGSNAKSLHSGFTASYLGGYANGTGYTDRVTIGDAMVQSQFVGSVTYMEGFPFLNPFNGILGLGPNNTNSGSFVGYNATPTFVQSLAAEGKIEKPIFGIYVNPVNADGTPEGAGEIAFGGVDKRRFKGEVSWIQTIEPHNHWEFNVTGLHFNGTTLVNTPTFSYTDTGSIDIGLPIDAIITFSRMVNGGIGESGLMAGFLTFPAGTTAESLPPLHFEVAGLDISVPASRYLVPKSYYPSLNITANDTSVYSWIASAGFGEFVLGQVWLQQAYTAYDMEKNRIGFAAVA